MVINRNDRQDTGCKHDAQFSPAVLLRQSFARDEKLPICKVKRFNRVYVCDCLCTAVRLDKMGNKQDGQDRVTWAWGITTGRSWYATGQPKEMLGVQKYSPFWLSVCFSVIAIPTSARRHPTSDYKSFLSHIISLLPGRRSRADAFPQFIGTIFVLLSNSNMAKRSIPCCEAVTYLQKSAKYETVSPIEAIEIYIDLLRERKYWS